MLFESLGHGGDETITAGILAMIIPFVYVDLSRSVHSRKRTIRWRCATASLRNPATLPSGHQFDANLSAFKHEIMVEPSTLVNGGPTVVIRKPSRP
jgi:hypothetical protein